MITIKKPQIVRIKKYEFVNNEERIRDANSRISKASKTIRERQRDGIKYASEFRS